MNQYFTGPTPFSPIPQPRSNSSSRQLNITTNYAYHTELTKEEREIPRTMPRKPRKTQVHSTHTQRKHKQSDPKETTKSLASASYYENTIQKLSRPNAPPPPLPIGSQSGKSFQSSLIDSLPEYCNLIHNNDQYSKNSTVDCSSAEFYNSTFISNSNSNFSTPKVSRSDLLFTTSCSNLISAKKCTRVDLMNVKQNTNRYEIGFENFEADLLQAPRLLKQHVTMTRHSSERGNVSRILDKLKKAFISWFTWPIFLKKPLFNCVVVMLGLILFFVSIMCIILFQTKVHQFNSDLLKHRNNASNSSSMNVEAASHLVQKTVQFCNGPYFSYQINNLIVLPISLLLLIIFSFFSDHQSQANKFSGRRRCMIECRGNSGPSLPAAIEPFQRRNRLLVAALFCIIANEIFKMIETSMFNVTVHDSGGRLNNMSKGYFYSDDAMGESSDADFLRIGLGIEPKYGENIKSSIREEKQSTTVMINTTTRSLFLLSPSVMLQPKPKLPSRLRWEDFQMATTTKEYHTSALSDLKDYNNAMKIVNGMYHLKTAKNKTRNVIDSFNRTLDGSSSKTLFQVSMSLYQNEYVQQAVSTILKSRSFNWTILLDKLEKLAIMLLEVLVIGMRYYPLLGILNKDSLVCLFLGSVYMWADMVYNIVITGMCEGLKMNVSFALLEDLRRLFGVGFILDVKDQFNNIIRDQTTTSKPEQMNTEFLFSTNRIIYSIVKSLPHFFCLSYVTVRLTATCVKFFYKRFSEKWTKNGLLTDSKRYGQGHYIDLVYTRKCVYGQIKSLDSAVESESKSFEERYVQNLFVKNRFYFIKATSWFDRVKSKFRRNDNFRFSTRVVCAYTVCFTVLYYLTCFMVFYGSIFIDLIYVPVVYKYAIVFSASLTSVICSLQLSLSMHQFKVHLKSIYKGKSDQYISPKSFFSNRKIVVSSFNYAGYAVTYTTWGYIFLFALVTFVTVQIATLFVFGSTNAVVAFVLVILLPFFISIFLIHFLNRCFSSIVAKFCFLQRKSKVLALKNLRIYSLFLYFKFFYDCFTGLAFCLVRMCKSILLGILFMSRIDYSFMGRSLERMDPAFMSYIGYLHWESHHTNPIAIAFCEMLQQVGRSNEQVDCNQIRRNRIINRWQMTYLLMKNPVLISMRKRCK